VFERIMLEPVQEELFKRLVEAQRSLPDGKRQEFLFFQSVDGSASIHHPGLPGGQMSAYPNDLRVLAMTGLLMERPMGSGGFAYDLLPGAARYYEYLHTQSGEPVQQIEAEVHSYIAVGDFQRRHPQAHQKWSSATQRLWSSDSSTEWTNIGHDCREAMQYFATDLITNAGLADQYPNPVKTVDRIRAVLETTKALRGDAEQALLDALLVYWGTVSDIVQRQEHGAQKEGEALTFEDARRVVFQTAIVMYEIDRSLSRVSGSR